MRLLRAIAMWVAVPVALGAFGYFFVGPRIGSHVPESLKKTVDDKFTMLNQKVSNIVKPAAEQAPPTPPITATPVTAPAQTDTGGPEVEVSVRTRPKRRAHHTTGSASKPKVHKKPAPKPKPEMTDEGSYGGTQDQGTPPTTGGAGDPPTGG